MPTRATLLLTAAMAVAPACHRNAAPTTTAPRAPAPVAAAAPVAEPAPASGPIARPPEPEPAPAIVGLEHAFEDAAAAIAPSVVSITSERSMSADLPPMLRHFADPDRTMRGLGSGVIVDGDGYIVTNNHVVADAEVLRVRLFDDREYDATVVGTDPQTDLAVIRIDAGELVPARLADDDEIRVGQWVLAAGSPFGLPKTITAGIVSATGRGSMGIANYGDFIQTDAAVNQGNSGGPLIDLRGRVVGINTAIASRDGGSNGIGFAIPIQMCRAIMTKLIEDGVVARGWLGVVLGDLTPELAASFGYRGRQGVLIDDVEPAGPGAGAGLKVGDIIDEVEGTPVRDVAMFRNAISTAGPKARVKLSIWRDGAMTDVTVALAKLPGDLGGAGPAPAPRRKKSAAKPASLGLTLEDVGPAARRKLALPSGAAGAFVASVSRGSVASSVGLGHGDVIVEVGDTLVKSGSHASTLLGQADLDKGVRLRVVRERYGRYVMLRRR